MWGRVTARKKMQCHGNGGVNGRDKNIAKVLWRNEYSLKEN